MYKNKPALPYVVLYDYDSGILDNKRALYGK